MKLSEIKGEKAIEVFADLLEPISKIVADEEVRKSFNSGDSKVEIIKKLLKGHAKEIIEALAILEGQPVEEYSKTVDFFALPSKLIEFFNDEAVVQLFTLQGQKKALAPSGSVMENTEESKN